jgi:MscS family membrane protein
MALLREVLDRVELPQYEDIPGDAEVSAMSGPDRWVIPNTKIEIVKLEDGPRAGQYLFSKDTVAEIPDFYELAKGIPYKAGALVGVYEGILASPGQWVPQRFPDLLPGWATLVVGGQGVWQWIALAVLAIVSLVLFRVLIRLGLNWDAARADDHPWLRFGVPIALLVVLVLSVFIQTTAENVIGLLQLPLDLVSYAALAVQLICGSWFVVSVSGRLADAIGRAGAKPDAKRHFDTALMRVLFRLVSLTVMAMLAIIAAEAVGIPIAPLVAGLGVGGLAIALAIRPTLEHHWRVDAVRRSAGPGRRLLPLWRQYRYRRGDRPAVHPHSDVGEQSGQRAQQRILTDAPRQLRGPPHAADEGGSAASL